MTTHAAHDDMIYLVEVMNKTTDPRALSIVCTSYVETHLISLLECRMPAIDNPLRKKLFSGETGIGTLSTKTNLALALGLIGKTLAADIAAMGSIRNKLAHNLRIDSFDHPVVLDFIRNFSVPTEGSPETGTTLAEIYRGTDNRSRFFWKGVLVCMDISNAVSAEMRSKHGAEY